MLLEKIYSLVKSKGLFQLLVATFIKVSMALSSFVIFYLTAKLMNADLYGRFAYGFSLATFVGGISTIGLHVGVFRWWSEIKGNAGQVRAEIMLLEGLIGSLLGGLLVGLLTYLVLSELHAGDISILAACIMIPIYALSEYLSSALRSKGLIGLSLLPRDLYWRMLLCVIFAGFWISRIQVSAANALAIMTVTLVPFVIWQYVALGVNKHLSLLTVSGNLSIYPARIKQSVSLFLSTSLGLATRYVDILLLGIFVSPTSVGAYFVAVRIANLLNIVQLSSNTISGPLIADAFFSGNKGLLRKAIKDITVPTTAVTVLGFILIAPLSTFILSIFNPEFATSWPELVILGSGVTLSCALGPTGYIMQMTGLEHEYLKQSVVSGILTLFAMFLAVYFYGSLGAAAGSSIGMVAIKIWNRQFIIKHLGLDPSIMIISKNGAKKGFEA